MARSAVTLERCRTIEMTRTSQRADRKTSKSRAFEILVAQIEKALASSGVQITSPDRIIDHRSGAKREVDVSLRYTSGSTSTLVTIECRDRSRVQDIEWIEQLDSKRQGIGADKTIAVSSRPFSKNALAVAKHVGIETRLISEVTSEDPLRWVGLLEMTTHAVKLSGFSMAVTTWSQEGLDDRARVWIEGLLATDRFEAKFLSLSDDRELRSPIDVLRQRAGGPESYPAANGHFGTITLPPHSGMAISDPGYHSFFQDVPADKTPVKKEVAIDFDRGAARIRSEDGEWELRQLVLCCEARSAGSERSVPRSLRYDGQPAGTAVEAAHHAFEIGGVEIETVEIRSVPGSKDGSGTA